MGFVIVATLVGLALGSVLLNGVEFGVLLGGIIGGLFGKVVQLSQQLGSLQVIVNHLVSQQKLAKSLAKTESMKPVLPVAINKKPLAEIIESKPAQTIKPNPWETVDIELPDLDEVPVAQTKTTPAPSQPTPTAKLQLPPQQPSEPSLGEKIADGIRRFFTEGNPIVRIGMVVMFFGLSFLVKYASNQGMFPIEFRLTCVLVIAIGLIILGWKTRLRAGGYGLVLQGGGIAAVYLTLFAAAKIFHLIPFGIAFGLLFVVVMLGAALALLQNAQVLAILATAGGFLAPILTSTGEGSHVALFSFYLLLNLGILTIAWYKAWRLLNWVGFMFTFAITSTWGVLKYEPTFYASTQPFLAAFFLFYLIVAILFSFKQEPKLKGLVDGSLVFGLPLIAFGLQTCLLKHSAHGLPISAVILSALYLGLAAWLARKHLATHRVLVESFLALGVGFATLAVPLALNASWTSATWALEAAGLVWIGLRQEHLRPRIVGYLLHCGAAISLMGIDGLNTGTSPFISGDFLNITILAFTALTISWLLYKTIEQVRAIEKLIAPMALAFGLIWWFVAGLLEINAHLADMQIFSVVIVFASITAAIAIWLSKRAHWPALGYSMFALLPFVILYSGLTMGLNDDVHPAHGIGLLALSLFFVVQFRFLFLQESSPQQDLLNAWHILTAWLLFGLIGWEALWLKTFYSFTDTQSIMLWFAVFTLPFTLLLLLSKKLSWPFARFNSDYKNWAPLPLFVLCAIWFASVCGKAQPAGEMYLPLLNVLDIAQLAVVLLFAYAFNHDYLNESFLKQRKARLGLLGAMVFIWINVLVLRAIHQYQSIPYELTSLWNSVEVQMALSILWAMCALVVMNLSRRLQQRSLWMLGAALLAMVVLKLAFKDLSGAGTLAGIISFMVVGGLMLLIGYLSPIPGKKIDDPGADQNTVAEENK
ncbi:MAG: DUF2339 domain-containing protein [Pseudomonadota bacterium]